MSAQIIDGKAIAADIRGQVANAVKDFRDKHGYAPGLTVVLVGDDPASQIYVRMKQRACEEVGIRSEKHTMPASTSQAKLLAVVDKLNNDPLVHGILVQLPLPDQIDENAIINAIDPDKDVDGFHPVNAGRLSIGQRGFVPCTPAGIMEMIHRTGTELKGKRALVIGRSNIVGKPTAFLLLREHATVTMAHSRTIDLAGECRRADVVVAAVGRLEMVKGDWIKPGAVVIDVGMNRKDDGKLAGDVHFQAAKEVAGHITPVPGGVGPMTIALLMRNTLESAKLWAER